MQMMTSRARRIACVAFGAITWAAPAAAQTRTVAIADSTLRAELLRRVRADQAAREEMTALMRRGATPDSAVMRRVMAVDSVNRTWLADVIARRGWPSRSMVGTDGAEAAFLLVQHADADTALQARALPLLERAYKAGEASGQDVALLTDRVATARKEPQVYGTQASIEGGHVIFKPIADSAHVDERRAAVGLMPLSLYKHLLDSVYTPAGRPHP